MTDPILEGRLFALEGRVAILEGQARCHSEVAEEPALQRRLHGLSQQPPPEAEKKGMTIEPSCPGLAVADPERPR